MPSLAGHGDTTPAPADGVTKQEGLTRGRGACPEAGFRSCVKGEVTAHLCVHTFFEQVREEQLKLNSLSNNFRKTPYPGLLTK